MTHQSDTFCKILPPDSLFSNYSFNFTFFLSFSFQILLSLPNLPSYLQSLSSASTDHYCNHVILSLKQELVSNSVVSFHHQKVHLTYIILFSFYFFLNLSSLSSLPLFTASILYTAVVRGKVALPCDITPPTPDDSVALILWYKDDSLTPLYTLDSRKGE